MRDISLGMKYIFLCFRGSFLTGMCSKQKRVSVSISNAKSQVIIHFSKQRHFTYSWTELLKLFTTIADIPLCPKFGICHVFNGCIASCILFCILRISKSHKSLVIQLLVCVMCVVFMYFVCEVCKFQAQYNLILCVFYFFGCELSKLFKVQIR